MDSATGAPLPRKYMAASVPRSLRQARLNYLPAQCIIGSRILKGNNGSNLYYDVIMLPVNEFSRMKGNVGLQNAAAPVAGSGGFNPGFTLTDTKELVVPPEEPDPEAFARSYFQAKFGCGTAEG